MGGHCSRAQAVGGSKKRVSRGGNVYAQGGFVLGLELPEEDRFYDDKADILELAGLAEASSFSLRVDAEPPAQLLAFLRLVNLSGARIPARPHALSAPACLGVRCALLRA
jgi:hypothetical protein